MADRIIPSVNITERSEAPQFQSRFHVIVKAIGSACNIDCSYCFYLHKEQLLTQHRGNRMPLDLLERYIIQHIQAHNGDEIVFSWQGGEPTLLGIPYFERIVSLQKKHCPPDRKISNNLQTNGTLLTEEWCLFLKENDFLVGISIDGPEELHNACRKGRSGQPTFENVMRGIGLLRKHSITFNTLTVVNRYNARYPREVYHFLRQVVGSTYIQFIPCVEPKDFRTTAPQHWPSTSTPVAGSTAARPGSEDSVVTEWSVDADDWGYFLSLAFDEWFRNDLGTVLVNLFETAVVQTMGLPAQICTMAQHCGKITALEHDGTVYSCDHYVYPEYALGNIGDNHLGNLIHNRHQNQFGLDKCVTLPEYCNKCEYLSLCWGECPKNRFLRTPDSQPGLNYLCSGFKQFFRYVEPRLKYIASCLQQ